MTKAEERALEVYPKDKTFTVSQRLVFNDMRDGFIRGYEQAEKDLALTWEDVRLIVNLGNSILDECYYKKGIEPHLIYQTEKQFSEEVLKRFKEAKK